MKLEHISKHFGTQSVLQDICATFETGHIYGLVGENGAGKSTLLRIMSGVLQSDGGRVEIDAKAIDTHETIKDQLIFVSDDPYFFPGTTIKELKHFYARFYDHFSQETYQEMLALFKLDENKKVHRFSKGMKRQVALLFALSLQTKYIFLDEAFDGLDPKVRLLLKQRLVKRIFEQDVCLLISSHNLRELEDIADTILILQGGHLRVSQSDTQNDLHKFQVVFQEANDLARLQGLTIVKTLNIGKVHTLYIKGDQDAILQALQSLQPLMCEALPLSMEERIVSEMEEA
ncbi:MAG: ABC transporter ATP-binding protein [Erysipelotrichaceae bacterium]